MTQNFTWRAPAPVLPREFYFPLDDAGFVVNPCRWADVVGPWRAAVEATAATVAESCGPNHSLYLRGSVALGRAMPDVSDLDFFLIADTPLDNGAAAEWDNDVSIHWPMVAGVELQSCTSAQLAALPSWQMALATQALLVGGTPTAIAGRRYRPGPDMVVHLFSIRDSLTRYRAGLRDADRDGLLAIQPLWRRWFCRVLVRAGFELVMARVPCYTRELYACYRQFAVFYPEQDAAMYRALELAINPEQAEPDDERGLRELATFLHQAMMSCMGDVYFRHMGAADSGLSGRDPQG